MNHISNTSVFFYKTLIISFILLLFLQIPILCQTRETSELNFSDFSSEIAYWSNGGVDSVAVIIKLSGNTFQLDSLNISYIPVINNFFTARISVNEFQTICNLSSVDNVAIANNLVYDLDASSLFIGATQGRNKYAVDGSGIIVGVIDQSFDVTNEDFKFGPNDSKVLYLWNMDGTSGTSPAEYDYGTEFTKANIDNGMISTPRFEYTGHGSGVAGVAAGTGRATSGNYPESTYVGVAPGANLILVAFGAGKYMNSSSVLDAMNYIRDKSIELDMPCIINLSSSFQGPRNGSSYLEMLIRDMIEFHYENENNALLVVTSAGNDGYDHSNPEVQSHMEVWKKNRMHAHGEGPGSFTVNLPATNYVTDIFRMIIWYSGDDTCSVRVTNSDSTTGWISTGNSGPYNDPCLAQILPEFGKIMVNNDDYGPEGTACADKYPNSSARRILFLVEDYTENYPYVQMVGGDYLVELTGLTGTWDAYITVNKFTIYDSVKGKASIDLDNHSNEYKIGEPGNEELVITVGSFNSKNQWLTKESLYSPNFYSTYNGAPYFNPSGYVIGETSFFSSIGPSREDDYGNKFIKPDILAPGAWIVSTKDTTVWYSYYPMVYSHEDSSHHVRWGTSSAAPHVAGALALVMELKHAIGIDTIAPLAAIDLLKRTADSNGGIDVLQLLVESSGLEGESINEDQIRNEDTIIPEVFTLKQNFPNPFNSETTIAFDVPNTSQNNQITEVKIEVINVLGQLIKVLFYESVQPGEYSVSWDGRDSNGNIMPSAIYFYRAYIDDNVITKKMILLK